MIKILFSVDYFKMFVMALFFHNQCCMWIESVGSMLCSESGVFWVYWFSSVTKNTIFVLIVQIIIMICGLINQQSTCAWLNLLRLERSGYHYYLICLHTQTYLLRIWTAERLTSWLHIVCKNH